ncbi:hypothetical protein MGN70_003017 [Eutypa lata]|nr:hypothetical protein MGN70_003017 [Eutypa lata]
MYPRRTAAATPATPPTTGPATQARSGASDGGDVPSDMEVNNDQLNAEDPDGVELGALLVPCGDSTSQ